MGKVKRRRNKPNLQKNASGTIQFKSTDDNKSHTSSVKAESTTKKDKIKQRRFRLLSKIESKETVEEEEKVSDDKKGDRLRRISKPKQKKGTEKSSVRQKKFIRGVKIFKMLMDSKEFKKNPKKVIAKRVASVANIKKFR